MSRIMVAVLPSASGRARRAVLMRLLPIILGVGVLCLSLPSYGQDGVPAFSGIWRKEATRFIPPYIQRGQRIGTSNGQLGTRAPDEVIDGYNNSILKPWTAEVLMEKAHYLASDRIYPDASTACWPLGVPGVFGVRSIQTLQTPDVINIVYYNDSQFRQIPLNQPHANPVEPSWYGDSVGHFEGETLVVDTIGFHAKPQAMVDDFGTPASDTLHVVERYRVLEDGRQLQVHITVEDPNVFRKPWSMTMDYDADDNMLLEHRCTENNRDWPDLMPIAETPDF